MIAMHALCQGDFVLDARMCTDEEFWLSPNAEAPAADAWFHHRILSLGTDYTGFPTNALNCGGWTITTSGSAIVVTTDGKPDIVTCSPPASRPVTCCAPIQ